MNKQKDNCHKTSVTEGVKHHGVCISLWSQWIAESMSLSTLVEGTVCISLLDCNRI